MRTLSLAFLVLALPGIVRAEPAPQFAARVHREAGSALPYRLLIPRDYTPDRAWPLVIWLHGSGEKGSDNAAQLKGISGTFLNGSDPAKCPAFVMVPQCPSDASWCPVGFGKAPEINEPTRMTIATIAELQKEFHLDDRRISVGGFSMGGYGVWEFIGRYPNGFAAAFPIAGTPGERAALAPVLKDLPIWVFQGDRDANAPVDGSRKMVAALQAAGGKVKYSEYPGMGHECARPLAEPGLPAWLFAQQRGAAASFTPVAIPEAAAMILKTLPHGTRGTWTGAVERTAHAAARLVIDGTRYRMKPAAGTDPMVAAILGRIGKGDVKGLFQVKGTIELSDYAWLVVERIEPAAGGA